MLSHSTRAKHRRQAVKRMMIGKIRVSCIDPRVSPHAWLVSYPHPTRMNLYTRPYIPECVHIECRGFPEAVAAYRAAIKVLEQAAKQYDLLQKKSKINKQIPQLPFVRYPERTGVRGYAQVQDLRRPSDPTG